MSAPRRVVIGHIKANVDTHIPDLSGGKHLPSAVEVANVAPVQGCWIALVANRVTPIQTADEGLRVLSLYK